jgi:uncharacterized integral membrane protein
VLVADRPAAIAASDALRSTMTPLIAYATAAIAVIPVASRVSARSRRLLIGVTSTVGATYAWLSFDGLLSAESVLRVTRDWLSGLSVAFALVAVGGLLTSLAPRLRIGPVLMMAGLVVPLLVSLVSFGLVEILLPAVLLGVVAAGLALTLVGSAR